MRMGRFLPSLLVAGFASLTPALLVAQGVTVTSSTNLKGAGVLGALMKMGGGGPSTTTSYISGHKMRHDNRDNSTIIDVDGGRFITINNKEKTYTVLTFEQMAQMMSAAADSMKAAKARGEFKQQKNAKPEDQKYEMDYSVKVDPTGEHQKVAGYDASRTYITITMGAHEKGQEARADEGQLVMLVDEWLSANAPNATAMREFQRAYAAKMGREFADPMKQMAAVFNANPQMKEGWAAASKEMAKQQGMPLKETIYFIAVPQGMTLDRQLAVSGGADAGAGAKAEEKQDKPKGGLFGRLKAAAAAAEQQQQQQGDQKGAPAKQSTLLSMATEVQEIKTSVPSDAFSIPAGYKELTPDMSRMR